VLWTPDLPGREHDFEGLLDPARVLGLELQSLAMREPGDLDSAFAAAGAERVDALLMLSNFLFARIARRLADAAIGNRLPMMAEVKAYAEAGGLMAYGANDLAQFRRVAVYVDRILKGAKPADLPVEQPTTFDFVINLKTAQVLGLTIPPTVTYQATELIQ
jgi:putative ABC transport system substrate-binding protein